MREPQGSPEWTNAALGEESGVAERVRGDQRRAVLMRISGG